MERVEDLLREEFRRPDPGVPTSRDEMLARVARARRRRGAAGLATLSAGLATLAVGVAAAAIAVTLNGPFGPSGAGVGGDDGIPRYIGTPINVIFTDARHGFAVQEYCSQVLPAQEVPSDQPTPDIHQQCRSQLLATADGGRSWQERTLPGDPATKDAGVDLTYGHSLMFWVDRPGSLALGGWNRRYWTTTDGGQTWLASPTLRDTGPAGSLAVFDRSDRLTFLATYPPGRSPGGIDKGDGPITAASDGSFWVTCGDDSPCVRVTRDEGRTWQAKSIGNSVSAADWVATADGETVFAGVRDAAGPGLMRSTDGGTTWTAVPGVTLRGGGGVVLPNDDLFMIAATEEGGVYRLEAGATALEKIAGTPAGPTVLYRSGRVLVAAAPAESGTSNLDSVISVSADGGATWQDVPAPTA